MIFFDIILTILLFALFAYSHTWLATLKIKRLLSAKLGVKIAFYRLFYNVSSLLIFLAFYSVAPKPDVTVYDLRFPYDIITFVLQFISLLGLYWASRGISPGEFIGISQIVRFIKREYSADDLDEIQVLRIEGASKFVRHPIYLFSILFLGLRPTMNVFYLTIYICIIVYFYIGSVYEERKLVELFGDEYRKYQRDVPRIFPVKFKRN